jgi:uncharacterized RDD family membrane protein YckC
LSDRSAGFARRLGAGTLDWALCVLLASVIALFVGGGLSVGGEEDTTLGSVVLGLLGSAVVVAYFAGFWARGGASPGMRALGIRLVDAEGRPPGAVQALLRAIAALASAASAFVILVTAFSDRPGGGYSTGVLAVFVAALAVAALSLLGHLWLLADKRQTWHDRLFGLLVVSAEATAAEPAASTTPPPAG